MYFPGDGNVEKGVAARNVRVPLLLPNALSRDQMKGRQFRDDGGGTFVPGKWLILGLNPENHTEFKCKRLSGGDHVGEIELYDIGFAMRCHKQTEKKLKGII